MRKNFFKLCAVALTAIIVFTMTACGNPSGGGGDPSPGGNPPPGTAFSVSGSFTKQGGGNVQFKLADSGSYARSVTAGSYAVSGELVDGDIIFRLSGTYDPVARSYTASSASSLIRYSINGAFDSSGVSLGSTATLLVRPDSNSENWTAFTSVITESAVTIVGTDSTEEVTGGIPSFARGWWSYSESSHGYRWDANVLLSQWTVAEDVVMTDFEGRKEFDSFNASVVEVSVSGSTYDVIMGFPVYTRNQTQVEEAAAAFLSSPEINLTATKLNAPPLFDSPLIVIGSDGSFSMSMVSAEVGSAVSGIYYSMYGVTVPKLETAIPAYCASIGISSPTKLQWEETVPPSGAFYKLFEHPEMSPQPYLYNNGQDITYDFQLSTYYTDLHGPPPFAEASSAIQTYLNTHGLSHIQILSEMPPFPTGPSYWFDPQQKNIQWFGFTTAQWSKIERWYTTNYLEKHLINAGELPQTRYSKLRASFSSNNTRMTVAYYGTPMGEYFDIAVVNSVSAARDLTQRDPESVTLRR